MTSEAQRIMNLSLTKIVSSRSRRGGVSLHRNLLVASVLFKARDVYAAEMAGLVVIRNGSVYDKNSLEYEELKPEVVAPGQSRDADPETNDSVISEEEIQKTLNAVVTDSSSSSSSLTNTSTSSPSNVSLDCDDDSESGKENVKPSDCKRNVNDNGQVSLKPLKRSRKPPNKQCKKRQYSELEQAVLSITDSTTGFSKKKKPRLNSLSVMEEVTSIEEPHLSLVCNEELSSGWSDSQTSAADNRCSNPVQLMDYVSYANNETSSSHVDDNGDEGNESVKYSDIGSYRRQSSCHAFSNDSYSSQSDSISFSLSHPVLVVSV